MKASVRTEHVEKRVSVTCKSRLAFSVFPSIILKTYFIGLSFSLKLVSVPCVPLTVRIRFP